jgi:hypothetical protein
VQLVVWALLLVGVLNLLSWWIFVPGSTLLPLIGVVLTVVGIGLLIAHANRVDTRQGGAR